MDEADGGAVDSHSSDLEQPEFQVSSIASGVNLTGILTRNQKYRKMLTLCEKLAIVSSQFGMVEFKKKYAEVQTIIRYWDPNCDHSSHRQWKSELLEVFAMMCINRKQS